MFLEVHDLTTTSQPSHHQDDQLKFQYGDREYLSYAVKSLAPNTQLTTDALHFALSYKRMELSNAKLVGAEKLKILHGDLVGKLQQITPNLNKAEKQELREVKNLPYVVMPLVESLHISLAILTRSPGNDSLSLMDSCKHHPTRDNLHEAIAVAFLQASGTYNPKNFSRHVIPTLRQADSDSSNCGLFAINNFVTFFTDTNAFLRQFDLPSLRKEIHNEMLKSIPQSHIEVMEKTSSLSAARKKRRRIISPVESEPSDPDDDLPLSRITSGATNITGASSSKKKSKKKPISSDAEGADDDEGHSSIIKRRTKAEIGSKVTEEQRIDAAETRRALVFVPELPVDVDVSDLQILTPQQIAEDPLSKFKLFYIPDHQFFYFWE